MPYTTPQNLLDRGLELELIQLTNLGNPANQAVNTVVLDKAIAAASAWMDSFVVAFLPLEAIPANFEQLCADETIHLLYKNTRNIPDAVKSTHDEALKYLSGVRDGSITLAADNTGAVDTPASDEVKYSQVDSVFSATALSGF